MEYSFLKIEQLDAITVMKVSAPKSLNALNSTVLKEIDDFVSNLDTKQTRVLIITGDGEKAFVAGADISEMVHLYEKEGYEFSKLGAIGLENKLFGQCFATKDQKEGMDAFLNKRKADFIGE